MSSSKFSKEYFLAKAKARAEQNSSQNISISSPSRVAAGSPHYSTRNSPDNQENHEGNTKNIEINYQNNQQSNQNDPTSPQNHTTINTHSTNTQFSSDIPHSSLVYTQNRYLEDHLEDDNFGDEIGIMGNFGSKNQNYQNYQNSGFDSVDQSQYAQNHAIVLPNMEEFSNFDNKMSPIDHELDHMLIDDGTGFREDSFGQNSQHNLDQTRPEDNFEQKNNISPQIVQSDDIPRINLDTDNVNAHYDDNSSQKSMTGHNSQPPSPQNPHTAIQKTPQNSQNLNPSPPLSPHSQHSHHSHHSHHSQHPSTSQINHFTSTHPPATSPPTSAQPYSPPFQPHPSYPTHSQTPHIAPSVPQNTNNNGLFTPQLNPRSNPEQYIPQNDPVPSQNTTNLPQQFNYDLRDVRSVGSRESGGVGGDGPISPKSQGADISFKPSPTMQYTKREYRTRVKRQTGSLQDEFEHYLSSVLPSYNSLLSGKAINKNTQNNALLYQYYFEVLTLLQCEITRSKLTIDGLMTDVQGDVHNEQNNQPNDPTLNHPQDSLPSSHLLADFLESSQIFNLFKQSLQKTKTICLERIQKQNELNKSLLELEARLLDEALCPIQHVHFDQNNNREGNFEKIWKNNDNNQKTQNINSKNTFFSLLEKLFSKNLFDIDSIELESQREYIADLLSIHTDTILQLQLDYNELESEYHEAVEKFDKNVIFNNSNNDIDNTPTNTNHHHDIITKNKQKKGKKINQTLFNYKNYKKNQLLLNSYQNSFETQIKTVYNEIKITELNKYQTLLDRNKKLENDNLALKQELEYLKKNKNSSTFYPPSSLPVNENYSSNNPQFSSQQYGVNVDKPHNVELEELTMLTLSQKEIIKVLSSEVDDMRQQLIAARDVIRGGVRPHSHEQGPDPNYPIQAQANRITGIGNDQNGVGRKERHDRDHYSGGTGQGAGLGPNSGFLGENKKQNFVYSGYNDKSPQYQPHQPPNKHIYPSTDSHEEGYLDYSDPQGKRDDFVKNFQPNTNSDFRSEENKEQIPLHNTNSPSSTPRNPPRIHDGDHEQIDIIQPASIEPRQNHEQINHNQNRRSTLSFW